MNEQTAGFHVDEVPLRDFVLKAYVEARERSKDCRMTVDAIRQFLSGPPGGETIPNRYWFEEDAPGSIQSYREDLERVHPQFAKSVFEPLLVAVEEMEQTKRMEVAPNLTVYVSSLAGACAVRAEIDETVAGAAVAAALLGLARLGRTPFEAELKQPKE